VTCKGRAVAQAVSRWLPTAVAEVRVRAACGVCGGQIKKNTHTHTFCCMAQVRICSDCTVVRRIVTYLKDCVSNGSKLEFSG
jgi:hypothetical protein